MSQTSDAPKSEQDPNAGLVKNSMLYKEFLAEREEILKHKWIESEKAGYELGFEKALLDWIDQYRAQWPGKRKENQQGNPPP